MRINIITIIFATALLSLRCAHTVQVEEPLVYLEGNADIKSDTLFVLSHFGDTVTTIEVNSQNTFQTAFPIGSEDYFSICHGKDGTELYLVPGDSLKLDLTDANVKISGKGAERNIFIQKRNSNEYHWWSRYQKIEPRANGEATVQAEVFMRDHYTALKREVAIVIDHSRFVERESVELDYKYLDELSNSQQVIEKDPNLRAIFEQDLKRLNNFSITDSISLNQSTSYLALAATLSHLRGLEKSSLRHVSGLIAHPNFKNHFMESLTWQICSREVMRWGVCNFESADAIKSIVLKEPEVYSQRVHEILNTYEVYKAAEGQQASFSYEGADGEMVSLKQFEGKYVLVHFWATWCGPCMAELPELSELMREFDQRDIELVGISIDQVDKKEKWKEKVAQNPLLSNHVQVIAPGQGYPEKNAITDPFAKLVHLNGWYVGIPHYTLIDPEGKIVKARFYRDFSKAKEFISNVLDDKA